MLRPHYTWIRPYVVIMMITQIVAVTVCTFCSNIKTTLYFVHTVHSYTCVCVCVCNGDAACLLYGTDLYFIYTMALSGCGY
jgi:hypothetical protein